MLRRVIRGAVMLILLACCFAGCGSHQTTLPYVAELARKCHEPPAAVAHDVQVSLREAEARGLHGSSDEAARALATLATFVEQKKERPDCKGLLRALVAESAAKNK